MYHSIGLLDNYDISQIDAGEDKGGHVCVAGLNLGLDRVDQEILDVVPNEGPYLVQDLQTTKGVQGSIRLTE